MSSVSEQDGTITRREAVRRVSALLGAVSFVGGAALLEACERAPAARTASGGAYQKVGDFSAEEVALLDEVADTILPTTGRSPGAKAAAVGPFMALMVTDSYKPRDQRVFRDGLKAVDEASRKASGKGFLEATPQQRLAVVQTLDREQKAASDRRAAQLKAAADRKAAVGANAPAGTAAQAGKKAQGEASDANLPDARQQNAGTGEAADGSAVTDETPPAHHFRMMKELALLGFFTSEIGYTKAMRYVEYPGRFEPDAPYKPGDKAWAPHA